MAEVVKIPQPSLSTAWDMMPSLITSCLPTMILNGKRIQMLSLKNRDKGDSGNFTTSILRRKKSLLCAHICSSGMTICNLPNGIGLYNPVS
jgi:hypothetical protein